MKMGGVRNSNNSILHGKLKPRFLFHSKKKDCVFDGRPRIRLKHSKMPSVIWRCPKPQYISVILSLQQNETIVSTVLVLSYVSDKKQRLNFHFQRVESYQCVQRQVLQIDHSSSLIHPEILQITRNAEMLTFGVGQKVIAIQLEIQNHMLTSRTYKIFAVLLEN